MSLLPIILSGGSGTRLWPLSRQKYPKQLLPLLGDESLLQATARRLDGLPGVLDPLVVCNEEHRFVVAEQLRLLGKRGALILEPIGRNTAPALALAALWALRQSLGDPSGKREDPTLMVMPADHAIPDLDAFRRAATQAAALAEAGLAVTFGITPDAPETGYGYLRRGKPLAGGTGFELLGFVEKPNRETAQTYLEAGDFFWNSGIFVFKASVWLAALERCRPDIFDACRAAMAGATEDGDFIRIDPERFAACPSDSIDYAVMEKLAAGSALPEGALIPLTAGWSDVGAWDSLWKALPKDEAGNATRGNVLLEACRDTLAISGNRLLACLGVDRLVVVETDDAILVAHQEAAQDVKKLVDQLKGPRSSLKEWHRKIHRPWGWFDGIDSGERFQVKRILVRPGASLSLQMHHHRAEHWIVVRGTARVTRGDEVLLVSENESTYIPLGTRHRLENPGRVDLEMIEVQSGSYLGEDDIVRLEDTYGRVKG